MDCPLCSREIEPEDSTVKPGPEWPVVHWGCFAEWDDAREAAEMTALRSDPGPREAA